ncbi:MAG: hypothetical protein IIU35_03425 [Neisseriaceae bacterium]|nr:hypothetical protein [Neisseriaceae bacterium]
MKKLLISILMLLAVANSLAESSKTVAYPDLQGKIIKEIKYTDKTGENVIVLTQTDISLREEEGNHYYSSQDLYAYRYLIKQGKMQKIWQIHDFIHDCEVDMCVNFIKKHIQITELNHNGIKEVWIPYALQCAGDISPFELKIIMYEDKQKYALRGESLSHGLGGKYKMDAKLKNNPAFSKFAKSLFGKIKKIDNYYE